MDRVTQNLVTDYLTTNSLRSIGIDKDFEKFACYSVVSRESAESVNVEDLIWVKESPAIDGIAIIVNGKLIEDLEEIDDLLDINNAIDAKFVFIQAKTTSGFDGADIGSFGFGVKDCFLPVPALAHNDIVRSKISIINKIYEKSAMMTRGLPECKLYYVTTGTWSGDQNLAARISSIHGDLTALNMFSKTEIIPLGASEVQNLYYESKRELSVEIRFPKKVLLEQMEGIGEAHVGVLPYEEFFKLIADNEGNLRPVFDDNIRAFQGDNDVNKGIKDTIRSEKSKLFAVLNNGVTVVARRITPVRESVILHDFQIVNGCQTCHVIYNNRNETGIQSVWVPVKLIVTDNDGITGEIIKATNNQTPIKAEELAALSRFQRDLEEYYKTYRDDIQLYYERRSKQYASDTAVNKSRVISIPVQIKAFSSMFLGAPHKVSRYYGTIKREIGDDIFSLGHKLAPYYVSALAYFRLEALFKSGDIDARYKVCRFYLLFAARRIVLGDNTPPLNSSIMEKDCSKLIDVFSNNISALAILKTACELMDSVVSDFSRRDLFKVQNTTDSLKTAIDASISRISLS